MKDIWYADNRDLVKWSVLIKLAQIHHIDKIIQVAYYRDSEFHGVQIDGESHSIPSEVINHFRKIHNIEGLKTDIEICIYDKVFENRMDYHANLLRYLSELNQQKCIVFLDPDTGLQPPKSRAGYQHVLNDEVKMIWDGMKAKDTLVFYQHGNLSGKPWKEPKRIQLASAIGVDEHLVKIADSQSIAHDVSFYYCLKSIS